MIGSRLGVWIIDKELGHGGMGRVYLAHRDAPPAANEPPVTQAALKVLSAELAKDAGFLHRFEREIDALSQLDHPHIVRFHEAGVHEGIHYYAMEYVPGHNFDEILHERSRLPWQEVIDMAQQVCLALKHAHDHGIIHRDIKPQNIMRTDDGFVKLSDFGVAKVFASKQLTNAGGLVGTADYLSPEQAGGKPVTIRSDLYSLGVVLYTLITGRLPFRGENLLDLLHQHRFGQFDRPQRIVPELPPDVDELICCLLEKEPSQRPANAQVLQRRLDGIKRKFERKNQFTVDSVKANATRADNEVPESAGGPGPATLMSQMMREELHRQNRAGPIGAYFEKPWVLITLLALCVGIVTYGFWPMSAATLFERGAQLMESPYVADLDKAWDKYFEPLQQKYPDHPYAEQLSDFRLRLVERHRYHPSEVAHRQKITSEAERLYRRGLRFRQDEDYPAAQRTWNNLVRIFDGLEAEQEWVLLAQQGLADLRKLAPAEQKRWLSLRAALERTRQLDQAAAEQVWQAIEETYRNDPAALPILKEVETLRREKK